MGGSGAGAARRWAAAALLLASASLGSVLGGGTDLFAADESAAEEIDANWLRAAPTEQIVLLNLYSGSCGHCVRFADTWNELAVRAGERARVVGLNCDVYRDTCTKYEVDSTPKVLGYAAGKDVSRLEDAEVLGESLADILEWLDRVGPLPAAKGEEEAAEGAAAAAAAAALDAASVAAVDEGQGAVAALAVAETVPSSDQAGTAEDGNLAKAGSEEEEEEEENDRLEAVMPMPVANAKDPPQRKAQGKSLRARKRGSRKVQAKVAAQEEAVEEAAEGAVGDDSRTHTPTTLVMEGGGGRGHDEDATTAATMASAAAREALGLGQVATPPQATADFSDKPAKDMLRHDIANAVRFGLEAGVFLGRQTLEGDSLQALFEWVNVLRQSFPGERERALLGTLLGQLKALQARSSNRIVSADFDAVMRRWDFARTDEQRANPATKWAPTWQLCQPRRLKDLSVYGGYPCALWNLLHVLSVSSAVGGASPDRTLRAVYGFIAHFFSCNECRDNFVQSNPDPFKQVLGKASSLSIPHSRALILWLWAEHNAVSRRLNAEARAVVLHRNPLAKWHTRHVFPEPDRCRSCRIGARGESAPAPRLRAQRPRDLEYLSLNEQSQGPNAQFREALMLPGRQQASSASLSAGASATMVGDAVAPEQWDFDALHSFLLHTYCFDDEKLRCPTVEGGLGGGLGGGPGDGWMASPGRVLLMVAVAAVGAAVAKPARVLVQRLRRRIIKSARQRH